MEVIISVAVSIDGYLDDCTTERLILSSPEDWQQVQELRVGCDAILVGAETVRKDNPSLMIRSEEHRQRRVEAGMSADITKITLTESGRLDPSLDFFTEGESRKIIFASREADSEMLSKLEPYAEVILKETITAQYIVDELSERGFKRLMVEGGSQVLTMFLEEQMVDRLRLAVAPLFVGDGNAPRLVDEQGRFVWNAGNRMKLTRVEQLGDMAVMHYTLDRKERRK